MFNDYFHLKMNYEKSDGSIFHEISHLINKTTNASWEDQFYQYIKDLLRIGPGTPSLIQLIKCMIKNKDLYVGYVIDHTPGSCYQRGSTRSEQNHSSGIYWEKNYECIRWKID